MPSQIDEPLISVLLPVKNGGAYLLPAVESLLRQQGVSLEIIVVNDHSSDNALASLPPHPCLRILDSPKYGVSAACNFAAEHATAAFLARMDADDIALEDRLLRQWQYMQQHPEIDICGADVEIFTEHGHAEAGYMRYQDWLNTTHSPEAIYHARYIESPIANPTAFFRREAYSALNGYADTPWHEDYDLFLRALYAGMTLGKPDGLLLRWRDHDGRSTRQQARYSLNQLMACKAHYLARHELAERAAVICGTGPVARSLFDALQVERVTVEAFVDIDPKRIGQQKRGRPVISYSDIAPKQKPLYLGALGSNKTRQALAEQFQRQGLEPERDYVLCA